MARLDILLADKSDETTVLRYCLADVRDDGVPSMVRNGCSDSGGEFVGGACKELCFKPSIFQEFTKVDTPNSKGVVEQVGLVQDAALAACLEAPRLFPDVQFQASAHLLAEACFWAFKPVAI